jgi:hypothetical protein
MPMDPRVEASPFYRASWQAMIEAFPPGPYRWIKPRLEHVETTDGSHLTRSSAQETAQYLDRELRQAGLYGQVE